MTNDQNRIVEILVKYALYESLSEGEARLLGAWRTRSEGHDALPDQLRDPEWIAEHRRLLKEAPAPVAPLRSVGGHRCEGSDHAGQDRLRAGADVEGRYGVRVSNPGSIKGVAITGKLPRSLSLEHMLKALEKVEGGHARLGFDSTRNTILVRPGKPEG